MHAFHVRHHPALRLDAPPGRAVSFVLWLILILLALLCVSARRTTAAVSAPFPVPATAVAGDCDGDGRVSLAEVQRAVDMYLGLEPPSCGVDADGDGKVSAEEVQRVLDRFQGAGQTGGSPSGEPPAL